LPAQVQLSCELKEVRRQLRAAATPQQLCEFLLVLESFLGAAGEGLPPGGCCCADENGEGCKVCVGARMYDLPPALESFLGTAG